MLSTLGHVPHRGSVRRRVGPSSATVLAAGRAPDAPVTLHPRIGRQIGNFALHLIEMCIPMCIGFAIGDVLYFWIANLAGYSEPFRQLPVLSVVLVTTFMTLPMVAWMRYRRMGRRTTAEMAASLIILAIALLVLGWVGALAMADLALAEHGLMMPGMAVAMLPRLDMYTGRSGHQMHGRDRGRAEPDR